MSLISGQGIPYPIFLLLVKEDFLFKGWFTPPIFSLYSYWAHVLSGFVYWSGFSRETGYIYICIYIERFFFFLWGLAHVVMEAKKSHDVMSANWRTRKVVVQLNPNEMPWESGSWWCKSLPEAENTRFRGTNVQGRTWILQVKQSEWIFPPSTFSFNSSTQQVGWCPLSLESNLLCTVYWFKW